MKCLGLIGGMSWTSTISYYRRFNQLVGERLGGHYIFDELCAERIEPQSRRAYQSVIADLADNGAEAVILGCTEIALLIGSDDVSVPVLDTTELHVRAAVDFALGTKRLSQA